MDDKNRTGCGDSRLPEDDPASGPTPALLDFLIAHHPGLYAVDELVRLYCSPDRDVGQERLELEEGIRALVADGLVHQRPATAEGVEPPLERAAATSQACSG
jgi:hypothetical protein